MKGVLAVLQDSDFLMKKKNNVGGRMIKFGRYDILVTCENCGKPCTVRIKRGVTIAQAVREKTITCDNCGCGITKWME